MGEEKKSKKRLDNGCVCSRTCLCKREEEKEIESGGEREREYKMPYTNTENMHL